MENAIVRMFVQGPSNKPLRAVYKNATDEFYDEFGRLVLRVCEAVPGGVLVFMASYGTLDKCRQRWQKCGIYNEISKRKVIVEEPRSARHFRSAIDTFIRAAEQPEYFGDSINGALLLGICRGKVSEVRFCLR